MSLIASSIMSKKLASGADAIVLDVKTGDGAFMKTEENAFSLAKEMVSIGTLCKKEMTAVISDMDQPLGFAVGNALEVKEAIETLQGNGPADLTELVLTLGTYMVLAGGKAESETEAREKLEETLKNGNAFRTFVTFIEAQGGSATEAEHPERLPQASYTEEVHSETEGFVQKIHTEEIGRIALLLGGGRETKESVIDLSVGLVLKKKRGDHVAQNESLAVIHANDPEKLTEARDALLNAYKIGPDCPDKAPIIKGIVK